MPRSPLSHSLRLLLSSNVSSYSLPLVSPLSPVVPVLPYPFRSGVVEGSNRSHVSPSITSLVSPHLLTYFCSLLSSLYFLPISCTSSYTSSPSFPSLPSHFSLHLHIDFQPSFHISLFPSCILYFSIDIKLFLFHYRS